MFDAHKKELEKLGYKVYSNKVTGQKGDVIATINPYGTVESKDPAILDLLKKPAKVSKVTTKPVIKEVEVEVVRARTDSGELVADDPSTPEVNEAWVAKIKKKVVKK